MSLAHARSNILFSWLACRIGMDPGQWQNRERIFLLERLAPWHSNRLSRLVKTPKLHMGDTGLACALLGIDAGALHKERERLGPLLETFVLQELRRQANWRPDPIDFFHFRDRDDFRANSSRVGVAMSPLTLPSAPDLMHIADFPHRAPHHLD